MGHRAPLSAAGPGRIIWSGLSRSSSGDGHQRGCYRAAVTLAESLCRAPHRLDPPRMFGSHHHLERASLARRPVDVFSIPSHDQNTSVARQGLSAASPNTIANCRQDYCVPGGRWSASSLRTSRRLSYCGDRTGGPVSACGAVRLLQLYCSDAMAPEPMHAAQVAAAPNVLFDNQIVSRDLHRQTNSQTG